MNLKNIIEKPPQPGYFTLCNDDGEFRVLDANGRKYRLRPESGTPVHYVAGTAQIETATAAGTVDTGVAQVETATAAGTIVSPVLQVETGTVVGTIDGGGGGDADVIITAAGAGWSPKTIAVAVANADATADVATKIRDALVLDADVGHADTGFFTVTGAGNDIILTAKVATAEDATMNIDINNGTCTGLVDAPTSTTTTAGVATGAGNVEVIVTSGIVTGTPLTVLVPVVAADDADAIALAIRTALTATAAVNDKFVVSGATDAVILTTRAAFIAANDTGLNIAIDNDTSAGVTPAASSANTTLGVLSGTGNATITVTATGVAGSPLAVSVPVVEGDDANAIALAIRTTLTATAAVTAMFNVSGATDAVILTRNTVAANDEDLNIAIAAFRGVTAAATSTTTTAGVARVLATEASKGDQLVDDDFLYTATANVASTSTGGWEKSAVAAL